MTWSNQLFGAVETGMNRSQVSLFGMPALANLDIDGLRITFAQSVTGQTGHSMPGIARTVEALPKGDTPAQAASRGSATRRLPLGTSESIKNE